MTAWNRLLREVGDSTPWRRHTSTWVTGSPPKNRYTETAGGYTMRTDGLHLAPEGVNWIAPWLYPRLLRLATR